MRKTREVTLRLRLPVDLADRAEEIQRDEPEFLERAVLNALARRSMYRHLRESD